jgi:uncharacterized OB-fold protein
MITTKEIQMKYFYVKRCKACGTVYYTKEISEEQFANIEENPNSSPSYENDAWTAEIQSCCSKCADERWDE